MPDAQLQSEVGEPSAAVPGMAMTTVDSAHLQGKSIAVIDDDVAVCESTRVLLEVYGLVVHTYQNAGDFLRDNPKVACVIVDYQMPGLSGLDVVLEMRRRGVTVPVLMITASRDPSIYGHAGPLGIRNVLIKPLTPGTLLKAILGELSR